MKKAKNPKAEAADQIETEVSQLKTQLARAFADYDNLKKRVEAEKEVWFKVASGRVIAKMLPVMDMLEDAQKHLNDQGLAIVLGEFRKGIIDEGFEEVQIKAGETEFNTDEMEAIEALDGTEENNNKVAEVVQSGWKAKKSELEPEYVVRPAKVKVFKLKES